MNSEQLNDKNELMIERLKSTNEDIKLAIKLAGELTDEFYRGPVQDTWVKLQRLVEYFQAITSNVEIIARNRERTELLEKYINANIKMQDKLGELLMALEKSDMVLAGDLLSYEVVPMLEAIIDTSEYIVDIGVDKDASS